MPPLFVIADLIRNPVPAWHWIPDPPDLIRGRDDKCRVRDDKAWSGMTVKALNSP
jgi:hypothetical protein